MSLFRPNVSDAQRKRIPPGQYLTQKWPVLHYGSVPTIDIGRWDFRVWGEVEEGMDHVDALPKGEPPANPGKIVKATVS